MSKNIYVEGLNEIPVPMKKVEIVERKGIGHPDSVADALAEEVSKALCKMYKKEILLVGRATTHVGEGKDLKSLPCKPVALKAAREYLRKTFPNLDVDSEIILDAKLGMGSDDLTGVYKASGHLANDTSFGVGYAPFSITDRLVLQTEEYINGVMKKDLPETGQDVKVMASRVGDDITMTVACAMIDKRIDDADHYKSSIEQLYNKVYDNALKIIGSEKVNFKLDINTGDDYDRGVYYLTCTGMSQEMGDDGSVGRGNRCNGLITPYRPMSMEATSGKNPITHIGKIYNTSERSTM